MRFGVQLRTLDAFADPRQTVRVARAAEDAGWEALLVWDHLAWASTGEPSADPWVTLGACAAVTERILLGTAVTPVARRRVQNLAQELATLSLASGGRVIFGAGLGGRPAEFEAFGEPGDARVRAERLDEGLELLARLLRGEPVGAGLTLAPLPVRPVPIWIGGNSRAALRRAARWDGWLADGSDGEQNLLAPDDVRARTDGLDLGDVAFIGHRREADLAAYEDAGVTWWIENLRGEPEEVLRRVAAGPLP
jgi:alkanesulfonate monooxygenase SsuD/methylene tetrahydromethanopterin reductase-like flavin-dependent oxidoreductase (luciferase family)